MGLLVWLLTKFELWWVVIEISWHRFFSFFWGVVTNGLTSLLIYKLTFLWRNRQVRLHVVLRIITITFLDRRISGFLYLLGLFDFFNWLVDILNLVLKLGLLPLSKSLFNLLNHSLELGERFWQSLTGLGIQSPWRLVRWHFTSMQIWGG